MAADHANPPGPGAPNRLRCIVAVRPKSDPPAWLVRGLQLRGARAVLVDSPAAVMVELATEEARAVVLDDPDAMPQADELVSAIGRYYPQVACWGYQATAGNGPPRLARIGKPQAIVPNAAAPPAGDPDRADADGRPPQFRPASLDVAVQGLGFVPPSVLTSQELAMLLDQAIDPDPEPDAGSLGEAT